MYLFEHIEGRVCPRTENWLATLCIGQAGDFEGSRDQGHACGSQEVTTLKIDLLGSFRVHLAILVWDLIEVLALASLLRSHAALPEETRRASSSEEWHDFGVDLLRVRPWYAVRAALDLDELHVFDHLRLPSGRHIGRQDAVVVAVNDHGWDVIAGDVLAEILEPGVDARHRCRWATRRLPRSSWLE